MNEKQIEHAELIINPAICILDEVEQKILKKVHSSPFPISYSEITADYFPRGEDVSLWIGTLNSLVKEGTLIETQRQAVNGSEDVYALNPAIAEYVKSNKNVT